MAQDLRDIFKAQRRLEQEAMPQGHETRFLQKLENEMPKEVSHPFRNWWKIAASVVVLLGLGYGAYHYTKSPIPLEDDPVEVATTPKVKTMGDISPDLKKVEDYYLASINLELSKIELTPDNKEIFDGYISRLEELQDEYNNLNVELTDNGPNPLTIDALINNLKLRLNLLYDLQDQLKRLNLNHGNLTPNSL